MADLPTIIAEVGFSAALTGTALHLGDASRGILGTATLGSADLFVDVSEYATAISTSRGARRADGPVTQYDTGTSTLSLRNDDRRFDPTNLAGPYVAGGATQVEPMRAVRYRAAWAGLTYPLWRGFTNQWTVGYDGPNSSWASVTCFDAFGVFAAHVRGTSAATGTGEFSGARIGRILDGINWPDGDRMLDTGVEELQATTLDGQVLSELQVTADSELGELWMDADGRVTFRDRNAPYSDTRSVYPLVHFGDEVADGDTTVNLVSNPSLETDTTGWTAIGTVPPTLSRSSTRAMFGSWSLLATWGTGGVLPGVAYDVTGLTPGRTYTASVYVWVPTGSPRIDTVADGSFGTQSTLNDQWERLTWTGTATSATLGFALWPSGSPTAGQQVWIDGFQVEEGTATDYCDGAQSGCEWDGVAHASTSRRLPELPAAEVELAYDVQSIVNHITATRNGGSEQTAVNTASQSAYLTRSYSRSDLVLQTDSEALMWAEQIVARTASPELRIASVVLKPTRDERLWPYALGLEIGDRIRVTKRPPGGGDPIVRDGWVRGIEHEVTVEQDWKTTLVLEQARDAPTVTDLFTRSTSSGLGTAPGGEVWTTSGGAASDYSTTGTKARFAMGSVNVARTATLPVDVINCDVLITGITISATPTGNNAEYGVRTSVDGTTFHEARVFWTTANTVTCHVQQQVAGVATASSSFPTVTSATSSTPLSMRLQVRGTTARVRVWLTSGTEPGTWNATVTTPSPLAAGPVTLRGLLASGVTNVLPVNIEADSITVSVLQAWN